MESFTLHPQFSVFPQSLQAAAATYLSIRIKDPNFSHWNVLERYPGYYTVQEINSLQVLMAQAVKEQQNPSCSCRETYSKYSTPEFGSVSLMYADQLADY